MTSDYFFISFEFPRIIFIFAGMKIKFNWKRVALFAVLSVLLLINTHSFLMSLGIMMILLLVDALLAQWEDKRRNHNKMN